MVTSLHVFLCVFDQSSNEGINFPTLLGVHQLVMHVFDAIGFVILCSPFEYLVSFRVFGETVAGNTWYPNTVH